MNAPRFAPLLAALLAVSGPAAATPQATVSDHALVMELLDRTAAAEEWAVGQPGFTMSLSQGSPAAVRLVLEYDQLTQRSRGEMVRGLRPIYGEVHDGRGTAWTRIEYVEQDPKLRRKGLRVAGRSGARWVALAEPDDVPGFLRYLNPTDLVHRRLAKPALVDDAARRESGEGRVSYTMDIGGGDGRDRLTVDFLDRALVRVQVTSTDPDRRMDARFTYGPVVVELPARSESIPERQFLMARIAVVAPAAIRWSARFVKRRALRLVARGEDPVTAIRAIPQDPELAYRISGNVRSAPRGITIHYRNRYGRWATSVRWDPRRSRIVLIRLD